MRNKQQLQEALQNTIAITADGLPEFTVKFKSIVSKNNQYHPVDNTGWGTGFFTGEYWLAYEVTKDEKFRDAALAQVDSFLTRIENHRDVDHHDMGFLYSLSCVAAYKLTGSETGKKAALLAADNLIARFHEVGGFLQAWGAMGAPENYRLIIDCLMNLPLLYWASEVTNDPKYATVATRHCDTAISVVFRDDFSTHHTYFFDPTTGAPVKGVTHQGYSADSFWARGQAWGIYGMALAYRANPDEKYLALFEKATEFFIAHLPDDKIPYWDLIFTQGSEPRDSSASAIAVCGILEMVQYYSGEKAAYYTALADELLEALIVHCSVTDSSVSNGLLLHGVYGKASPYNTMRDNGVDECNAWGDYFYMEALVRKAMDWKLYW